MSKEFHVPIFHQTREDEKKIPKNPTHEAFVTWYNNNVSSDHQDLRTKAAASLDLYTHFDKYVIYNDSNDYSDGSLLVINKPPFVVAHGNGHNTFGISEIAKLATGNPSLGITHRLDRDTTGVMVLGKNKKALVDISQQFGRTEKGKETKKKYLALVQGAWEENVIGVIVPISKQSGRIVSAHVDSEFQDPHSKTAATGVKILGKFTDEDRYPWTLLSLTLFTGRTHQLRVTTSYMGTPIYGDPQYNQAAGPNDRQFLHAYKISFNHPDEKTKRIEVVAPLPQDFRAKLGDMTCNTINPAALSGLSQVFA